MFIINNKNNNNKQRKNMNNFKKIGMTALAASLVSTSVFAGELTATGSASITMEGYSGSTLQSNTAYSMADSVILSGSTELDNAMTVSMSFELDADNPASGSSYDDKSVTISSDAMGTLKFSGHGGSSATSAIDATAAGNIYDNFDGAAGATGNGLTSLGVNLLAAAGGNNSIYYTLPAMVDGLAVNASLNTAGATGNNAIGYNMTYSGVEGLSVSYGIADINTGVSTTEGDQQVLKASYAYGPITASWTNSDYDKEEERTILTFQSTSDDINDLFELFKEAVKTQKTKIIKLEDKVITIMPSSTKNEVTFHYESDGVNKYFYISSTGIYELFGKTWNRIEKSTKAKPQVNHLQ